MRLRLRIERNALPPVHTLWPVKDSSSTMAQLLQQINEIFPLEGDTWGLEDYALSLAGYGLIHYHLVREVLKDEDEVVIKPLKWEDLRSRTITGRDQITSDGRHLVDGVPFGRPALRAPTRPDLRIPPRKKRRLSQGEELLNGTGQPLVNGNEEEEVVAPLLLEEGVHKLNAESEGDSEDSENDLDFEELDKLDSSWNSDASTEDDSDTSSEDSDSDDASSDSDSSSNPSESDDEEAWEGIANSDPLTDASKTKKALANGSATSRQKSPPKPEPASKAKQKCSAANEDDPSGPSEPRPAPDSVGIPYEGKTTTQNRNARRRDAKRLKHMKSSGALPQDMTLAQYRELVDDFDNPFARLDELEDADDEAKGKVNEAAEINGSSGEDATAEMATNPTKQVETTQATSETEPPKKKKKSKKVDFASDAEANVEEQRRQLVKAISSGGIDVDGENDTPDASGAPGELSSGTASASNPITASAMVPPSVSANARRAKLDLAGSKRLLFGSLGVRVPKTQDEKDALQKRLSEQAERKAVLTTKSSQTNGAPQPSSSPPVNGTTATTDEVGDSWRDKINLSAVECVDEDVTLSEPPFPFHQRWDPQYNRRGKKRASSVKVENGGKKRKRGELGDEQYDRYNADGYGDALNYDDEGEEDEYWEDGALLDGEEEIDDDEDGENAPAADDLPSLPSDLTTLPLITVSEAKEYDIITFTELACDASTGWQPQMTTRTARVIDPPSNGETFRIQLSARDVKPPIYDEEGKRVYSKFEMPQDGGEDEREREVAWGSLGEVRLVLRVGSERCVL